MKRKQILCLLPILLLTSCNASQNSLAAEDNADGKEIIYDGETETIADGIATGVKGNGAGEGEEDSSRRPNPHQLTAKALDDNEYYDDWKKMLTEVGEENKANAEKEDGLFYKYHHDFSFKSNHRLKFIFPKGTSAKVELTKDQIVVSSTKVDKDGVAYLFPTYDADTYDVSVVYQEQDGTEKALSSSYSEGEYSLTLENSSTITSTKLQLMFVIDATGSMSDEMEYLKSEIDDVIGKVKNDNPDIDLTLAMMTYRDQGDEYVTRYSDFNKDITISQEFLKKQHSDGGGDFPEAVDVALEEAVDKQWYNDDTTKLLFHVADAPSHDEDVQSWNSTVRKAAEKGISILPVASSGIDLKTEYFFRSEALLTKGTYLYLTDESGIGNGHLEASTKHVPVTEYLNDALVRLINSYYRGEKIDPVPYTKSQQ